MHGSPERQSEVLDRTISRDPAKNRIECPEKLIEIPAALDSDMLCSYRIAGLAREK